MTERRLALLSVSDKRGIESLGRGLVDLGFTILSTGGTARALAGAGVPITKVSEHTGAPEVMDGRVKTLHPVIHGGILARETDAHLADLERIGGELIDLVAVNLYPFERTAAQPNVKLPELVEQIDIGGPTLLRAAAKNFHSVVVVPGVEHYSAVMDDMRRNNGAVSLETRRQLAAVTFDLTSRYDSMIHTHLSAHKD